MGDDEEVTKGTNHPDVKAQGQMIVDYVLHGTLPPQHRPGSGGSPNMKYQSLVLDYLSGLPVRDLLLEVVSFQAERSGGFQCFKELAQCEQWVGPPHAGIWLTADAGVLWGADQNGDGALKQAIQTKLVGFEALCLAGALSNGTVALGGARQERWGWRDTTNFDTAHALLSGRRRVFRPKNVDPQNCGPYVISEIQRKYPHFWDNCRGIPQRLADRYWPGLACPMRVELYEHGHHMTLTPTYGMGAVGRAGCGCVDLWAVESPVEISRSVYFDGTTSGASEEIVRQAAGELLFTLGARE